MDKNSSSAADDIEEAGKRAVRSSASIVKAGSRAAAGDYIGAAKDIITDPDALKAVLLFPVTVLLILSLILVSVLYVLPMMIFETVENIVQEANVSFQEAYYTSEGSGLSGEIHRLTKSIGEWLKTAGKTIAGKGSGSISESELLQSFYAYDFNALADTDSQIISREGSHIDSLYNKISQIKAKYSYRVNCVENSIVKKKTPHKDREYIESESFTGYSNDFLLVKAYEQFSEDYDVNWDVMTGAMWVPAYVQNELTSNDALHIAALYDVINDNNFEAEHLTDFLKWLGYADLDGDTLYFPVMEDETEISGWTGTFMPQYLLDEAAQEAESSAESECRKTEERLSTWIGRLFLGVFTEEGKIKTLRKVYDEAYRETLEDYFENYGVSFTDLLIYAYTGKLTQTEEIGEEDPDKNLLVVRNRQLISSEEYGINHPKYTYDNWRYSDYGSAGQKDLYRSFIEEMGLQKYVEYEEGMQPDGKSEGYVKLTTQYLPHVYEKKFGFSMSYSEAQMCWYYTITDKSTGRSSTYTSNPVKDSSNARSRFNRACSEYGITSSNWGYSTTAYTIDGHGNSVPVTIQFEYDDSYTVNEPYITAQFFKYYYKVSYFCPYYIGFRPESEMLSLAGLLEDDYSKEYTDYLAYLAACSEIDPISAISGEGPT